MVGAPGDAPRRAARAAAHLQQGPPGGQGAALRRDRHARAVPARGAPRCSQSIEFDRERMAAAASDEFIAATDVADLLVRRGVPFREAHGIVGGVVRAAVERGKRLSELTDEELAELAPQLDGAVPRAARAALVARVEGLRGRHGAGARARPARPGAPRAARGAAREARPSDFYDRSVHEVARDLIGCVVRHGETAGPHRRDRELPHGGAGLPRVRRASRSAPARCSASPGRAYVYFSYGIHSLLNAVAEHGGRGRRGADPGARAGRRHRADARAARRSSAPRTSARARASSPRRSASGCP